MCLKQVVNNVPRKVAKEFLYLTCFIKDVTHTPAILYLVSKCAHNPWSVVTLPFEYQLLNIQLFMTLTPEKDHVSLAASSRNQQCSCSGQKISIIDQLAPAIVLNAQWLRLRSPDVSEDFG
jgi:hypothetical protein